MVDGDWIDDPDLVKQEFRSHFADRFQDPGSIKGSLNFLFPNRLSNDHILDLESPISKDEIRTTVWGYGVDKSPGQTVLLSNSFTSTRPLLDLILALQWNDPKVVSDYRPISLIGSLYKVVTKILATRLSLVISDLISDVQTAFLPNIQILEGPFIINEILAQCKLKKKQAMIFKVDFAKAYNSIRWDFLDDVLVSFGFGSKWRSWIRGSLSSGKASILVNGSPTPEFHFHRGLKQGDPLAPFIFFLGCRSRNFYRNFFNGIQDGDRKIAWVKWSKVLASKKYGGLRVSSFYALNRALLFKWVWRYLSHDNSLWSRVIYAIHGLNGQVLSAAFNSTWSSIINEFYEEVGFEYIKIDYVILSLDPQSTRCRRLVASARRTAHAMAPDTILGLG
nr:hypothetical protein [Tanacetum cinerariifolium]